MTFLSCMVDVELLSFFFGLFTLIVLFSVLNFLILWVLCFLLFPKI